MRICEETSCEDGDLRDTVGRGAIRSAAAIFISLVYCLPFLFSSGSFYSPESMNAYLHIIGM